MIEHPIVDGDRLPAAVPVIPTVCRSTLIQRRV
jgi:hypothetical protein